MGRNMIGVTELARNIGTTTKRTMGKFVTHTISVSPNYSGDHHADGRNR